MPDTSTKWIAHDYSVYYILQKILICDPKRRAFRYLSDLINRAVDRPLDSWKSLLKHVANKYGMDARCIQRSIRFQLWISLLFKDIDEEFFKIIEADNRRDTKLWRRRVDPEYIVGIVSEYRREIQRSKSNWHWKRH